jgi:hypothetical protein
MTKKPRQKWRQAKTRLPRLVKEHKWVDALAADEAPCHARTELLASLYSQFENSEPKPRT